jgi:SAM-dependent methyltransferase
MASRSERGREVQRLAELGWPGASIPASPDGVHFVNTAAVHYPDGGLAMLGLDGGQGYWFDHRAREVVAALADANVSSSIWDVGAGSGSMASRLARAGFDVVAVEPLPEGAAAIAALRCGDVYCGTLDALGLPDRSIDAVGFFDVLEHLDDPGAALDEARRVLAARGVVVVTVPAFQWLWSNADENAGHRVRYTRRQLDRLMTARGFRPLRTRYIFASLLPLAFLLRTVPYRLGRRLTREEALAHSAKRLAPNPGVDRIARAVLGAEHHVGRRVPLPFGLSVLGVYRVADAS